jgi:nucleoside-diphosphate-sugar epimerase
VPKVIGSTMREMTEPIRVAFTGGEGLIAGIVRSSLSSAFEPRWLTQDEADVTDLGALERAFAGIDAVVHLAANAENDAGWDELLAPNVIGAHNVFEASRRAGVRRVIFASSNHAMGMYMHDDDRFADADHPAQVPADAPVRPDSLYGASKAWGEALGRLYAEKHGLEVVCLRIGWVPEDDAPPSSTDMRGEPPRVARRAPGMWLSHRDCASLIEAALTADVQFAIVNGVSDNRGRWFTLDEGRRVLGWQPRDGIA